MKTLKSWPCALLVFDACAVRKLNGSRMQLPHFARQLGAAQREVFKLVYLEDARPSRLKSGECRDCMARATVSFR
jgi:hypothetical protein